MKWEKVTPLGLKASYGTDGGEVATETRRQLGGCWGGQVRGDGNMGSGGGRGGGKKTDA